MYISMSVLWEELSKNFSLAPLCSGHLYGRNLSGAALFTSGASDLPDPHTVYITEARRLPAHWKSDSHISLIVVGSPAENYFDQADIEYFCVNDKRFSAIFNYVLQIFQKYYSFDNSIKRHLLNGDSPESLCDLIEDFLQVPFIVFDESLRLQYISPNASGLLEWENDMFSGRKVMPTEFVNQLSLVFTEKARCFVGSAVLLQDDRLPYNLITTMNGRDNYIIAAFETARKFTHGIVQLIDYIHEYILLSFQNLEHDAPDSRSLPSIILSMLEGVKFSTEDLKNLLSNIGWQITDCCCCIVIYPLDDQKTERYNYLNPFCLKLENQFHDCIAIPCKGQIVAIVNLDKAGCSVYDISHSISFLIRDGLLKAGISFKYWSFETTPIYYQQACYAYEMGQVYNPNIWCYIFEDYALYHFIHYGSSRLPPRHLCHPALVELHGYDKANGTDLLKTLEAYVQNNCNAATAAGALYIHRNTFYQRMSKIRELVNLNLDDPNVRLYLLISTELIRMYYYELENGFHFPHE